MDAITEIDKAGRLVIPKRFRDALHLVPGTRLTLCQRGDVLVISAESRPRGLYVDRGTLVYDAGSRQPSDIVQWIEKDRDARIDALGAIPDAR